MMFGRNLLFVPSIFVRTTGVLRTSSKGKHSTPLPNLSVSLIVGDIADVTADAIVVSSNPTLAGNLQSNYWRFSGRKNTNGSVRRKGEKDLDWYCQEALQSREILQVGEAITTRAGQNIPNAQHVIHVVVPDRITHYDGKEYGDDREVVASSHLGQHLRDAYLSVLGCAEQKAKSLAIPALGCGIKGWSHEVSAKIAGQAITDYVLDQANKGCLLTNDDQKTTVLKEIIFVLQSHSTRNLWATELKRWNLLNVKDEGTN